MKVTLFYSNNLAKLLSECELFFLFKAVNIYLKKALAMSWNKSVRINFQFSNVKRKFFFLDYLINNVEIWQIHFQNFKILVY